MAARYEILWTGPALRDLDSIREHIAAEGRPMAARRLPARIRERVELLALHPHSGRQVPEFPGSGYREVIVAPYRVVYELVEDRVQIPGVARPAGPGTDGAGGGVTPRAGYRRWSSRAAVIAAP